MSPSAHTAGLWVRTGSRAVAVVGVTIRRRKRKKEKKNHKVHDRVGDGVRTTDDDPRPSSAAPVIYNKINRVKDLRPASPSARARFKNYVQMWYSVRVVVVVVGDNVILFIIIRRENFNIMFILL